MSTPTPPLLPRAERLSVWIGLAALLPALALPATRPLAYLSQQSADRVVLLDVQTGAEVGRLDTGDAPFAVAAAPNGQRVYVGNLFANSLSVIDTAVPAVIATVSTGQSPYGIAVSADSSRVYVANSQSANLQAFDAATLNVVGTVAVGTSPGAVALHPTLARAYVSAGGINRLTVVDTQTFGVLGQVETGVSPWGVAVHPSGQRVYVSNWGGNTITVIDTTTLAVLASPTVGTSPLGIAVHPDGSRIYVVNMGSDTVSVLDTQTHALLATIPVGLRPFGVAIDASGQRVVVSNTTSASATLIDTATHSVVWTSTFDAPIGSVGAFVAELPLTVPGAPTLSATVRGDRQVQVDFLAPASNGGSAILDYTAQCGAQISTGSGLSLVVAGLVNGTPVQCRVAARNAQGSGAWSALSAEVTPATIPDPPTIVDIVPGDGTITIHFVPPLDDGGSPITMYNAFCQFANSNPTSPIVFHSLQNGVPQVCRMNAINGVGGGAAGPAFAAVTPGVPAQFSSTAAPAGVFGTPYSHQLSATGDPAPAYSVVSGALPEGLSLDGNTGLISGTPSAVTSTPASGMLQALNGVGAPATQAFAINIAAGLPAAPTISGVTREDGALTVHFDPPANTGGVPLDGYTATCAAQSASGPAASTSLRVTGLSNFVPVSCTVRSTNVAGDSPESAPTDSIAPMPDLAFADGFE